MNENTAAPVYLSVALALDELGECALHQSSGLLAASSHVRCLRIQSDGEGLALIPLAHPGASVQDSPAAQAPTSKPSTCHQTIASAARLRAGLSAALHELRAHRNLLHSSTPAPASVYLDIYLLGDLAQPATAGLLIPVLLVAADLLADEPDGMLHLLLGTAIFPAEQTPQLQAGLLISLTELGGILECIPPWQSLESSLSQQLHQEPGAASSLYQSGRLSVYLFDLRKEGALEVSDRDELALLASNALGALHSAGLAQRLASDAATARLSAVQGTPSGPFGALGVSALGCDTERLMQSCVTRLSIDFLEQALAKIPSDSTYSLDLAQLIIGRLGSLEEALEQLISETPFVKQYNVSNHRNEIPDLQWARPNFPLPGAAYQGLAPSDWLAALQAERARLESDQLPSWTAAMQAQAARQDETWQAVMQQALLDLPQLALGDGASLQDCSSALQRLEGELRTWLQRLAGKNAEEDESQQAARFSQSLQDLQRMAAAHHPRRTLHSLWQAIGNALRSASDTPGVLSALAEAVVQWWLQHDRRLIAQRQQCELVLACWASAAARCIAIQILRPLLENLLTQVAQAYEHLDRLELVVEEALNHLEQTWEAQEPAQSPLRRELATLQAARWCVQRWQPDSGSLRFALLHQFGLLSGWQVMTPEDLVARLASYGRILFTPLLDNLALSHLLNALPAASSPQQQLSGLLIQAVLPLRPRFDSLGGAALASEAGWLLLPTDLQDEWKTELVALAWPWQSLAVPGLSAVFCCRARLGLPLAALTELTRSGQKALALLDPQELAGLFSLAELLAEASSDPLSGIFLSHGKANGRCSTGIAKA